MMTKSEYPEETSIMTISTFIYFNLFLYLFKLELSGNYHLYLFIYFNLFIKLEFMSNLL
jgi:hypothetical protein